MKKKYWFKFGLVGGILFVFLFFVWIIFFPSCTGSCPPLTFEHLTKEFLIIFQSWSDILLILQVIAVSFITGFILSSIVGLIYGKIKNRNKVV